jgi:hypothetical protein
MGPDSEYEWLNKVVAMSDDITRLIPAREMIILVDEGSVGPECFPDHKAVPFLEREGKYWGAPAEDQQAQSELRRLMHAGANYLAIGFQGFWWLDAYPEFSEYLSRCFDCIKKSDHVIIYDLRDQKNFERHFRPS